MIVKYWTSYALCLVTASLLLSRAQASEERECITQPASFSGVKSLHYSKVIGKAPDAARQFRMHPTLCNDSNRAECNKSTAVPAGAVIAVSKTCGSWAFSQYIGENSIRTGWIEASRLALVAEEPPENLKEFRYTFKLARGRELPVCEAYLQRINMGIYERPPYCGRPDKGNTPGFQLLKQELLSIDEIRSLFPTIYNFWLPQRYPEGDGMLQQRRGEGLTFTGSEEVDAWRYSPQIDIENSGKPMNVIMWRGFGVDGGGACGAKVKYFGDGFRQRQVPNVMDTTGQGIVVAATESLLKINLPPSVEAMRLARTDDVPRFKAIGRSIGIFEYRGQIYLDAFPEPPVTSAGSPLPNPPSANRLTVFVRRNGKTSRVCEYQMAGTDFPTEDDGV